MLQIDQAQPKSGDNGLQFSWKLYFASYGSYWHLQRCQGGWAHIYSQAYREIRSLHSSCLRVFPQNIIKTVTHSQWPRPNLRFFKERNFLTLTTTTGSWLLFERLARPCPFLLHTQQASLPIKNLIKLGPIELLYPQMWVLSSQFQPLHTV